MVHALAQLFAFYPVDWYNLYHTNQDEKASSNKLLVISDLKNRVLNHAVLKGKLYLTKKNKKEFWNLLYIRVLINKMKE